MTDRIAALVPRSRRCAAALLVVLVAAVGCGDDDSDPAGSRLDLTFDGLEPLGAGFVYEGWLIVDGAAITSGRFSLDEGASASSSTVDSATLAAASTFVLTIEPEPDPDPGPADTHVLAGDFDGDRAELTVGHGGAFGDDFTSAAGVFILETPTSAAVAADFRQGIWWLDPALGPGSGLALPVLPAGWAYEGWVVGADGPVSTGRFTDPAAADDDAGGPDAGPDPAPPFPGQDFVDPALDLLGVAAVISIEPEPDDSPAPFTFKPLVDPDVADVGPGVTQPMENRAGELATGTATRS